MRVIGRKSLYNYLKAHPFYKKDLVEIVERIEHASWRDSNDALSDLKHLKNIRISFRNEKEVVLTIPDDKIRLLFKVAYNMGVVIFK
jgi:mRNA-degrading endonuclease HigB of HigAB toxin-antitoxin module